jgi:outer membrane protein assembly factor BamB
MNAFCLHHRLTQLSIAWVIVLPLFGADWAQWHGPHRDGQSAETGLLQEWPKEGPKLLWQVKNIGWGFSTPSVVGDRVYVISNEGLENEFAQALSGRDGQRIWSTRLGVVGHPKQNPNYPAARSTPTVDGKLLYVLGSDGDLACLETATGKEQWRKHLRHDFGGKHGEWAYAESPLVDGNAVICTPGGSNATLVALNKMTGEVMWKCATPEADDAAYASMVVAEFSGVKQYVQFLAKGLVGVEAKTGKLLWRYERSAKGSPAVVMTPLVSDGYIYSGAFRAGGAVIKPTKKDGAFVVEELYFNKKLPCPLGGVVKVGDYFYGTSEPSVLCVDFKTGAIQWQERSPELSWLVADGRLYAHGDSGDVVLIEPSPASYREKGRFTPPDRPAAPGQPKAFAQLALANGRLYVRELNSLWCYDVKTVK